MKSISLSCVVLIAVLSLIAACGGGGGGSSDSPGGAAEADFASITIGGAGTVLYTETTNAQSPSGYSPYVTVASSSTSTIGTYLHSLEWDGSNYVTRFEIHIWGSGPGTYNILSDNALVYFSPTGGPTYSSMSNATGSGGTITLTEFGSPGEKVKGTFDVISRIVSSSTPTQTAHLTGSFSITR